MENTQQRREFGEVEILPPVGISRTPKVPESFFWLGKLLCCASGFSFGFAIKYLHDTFYMFAFIGLLTIFIALSAAAERTKVINAVRRINKSEISIAEVKGNISKLQIWRQHRVPVHVRAAVKRGFLPEYKYLPTSQRLVRIK